MKPSWPIKKGRLSGEEKSAIEAMGSRGLKAGQIAMKLGRHPSTINFAMHCMGLKRPVKSRGGAFRRGNVLVVPFSDDEDAFLTAARIAGHTHSVLSRLWEKRFGHARTPCTLRIRSIMLANEQEAD